MFIINFKLDYKKMLLILIVIAVTIATIIEFSFKDSTSVNNKIDNFDYSFTEENYTTLLKEIHDNIDQNIGKTVKISGYVFRMPDFKENFFVCGRNVTVNPKDMIAGILCQYDDAKNLKDSEWVELTGVIIKGEYKELMPVLKIDSVKKITAPANTYVTTTPKTDTTNTENSTN